MEETKNTNEEVETKEEEFKLENDLVIKATLTKTTTEISEDEKNYKINLIWTCTPGKKVKVHWGVYLQPRPKDWVAPKVYPDGSTPFDNQSVDTMFSEDNEIKMNFNLNSKNCEFHGINFVFHNTDSNVWYNNGGSNYTLEFVKRETKANGNEAFTIPDCIRDGMNCEAGSGSWCLKMRFEKVRDALFQLDVSNPKEAIWIYLWLKYSYRKLLTWQRHYNTVPRDLQWSMHTLTFELTKRFSDFSKQNAKSEDFTLSSKSFMKDSLVTVGKGRSNGQLIRDEILNIFHKHNISEKIESFYEQWHQKLHNNTTPDDIVICQALVNFLRSGNIEDYRKTLYYGGINKERLESFDRKITMEPYYAPQYLGDFENYLHILKEVHGSSDLVLMYDQCKYALEGNKIFDEILYFKDDWDTVKQIWRVTMGRETLFGIINNNINDHGKLRDLLFFDSALELYLRSLVEKIAHINLDFGLYINQITALLRNIILTHNNYDEIQYCLNDWNAIAEGGKGGINDMKVAMKIKSVCDRVLRLLGHVTDYYNTEFDPKAKAFGEGCNVDKFHVDLFTEEEIRGSIFFAISVIMKKIEPILRQKANLGAWLIISRGDKDKVYGKVKYEKDLHKIQMETFKEPTILVVDNVGGGEEIPMNCVGVVINNSSNYPDMLAHVSVRARNLKVPFAVCFDGGIAKGLIDLGGNVAELKVSGNNFEYSKSDESKLTESKGQTAEAGEGKAIKPSEIEENFENPFIELNEFTNKKVGAKSNNTMKVFNKLPSWIKYPESFAIPFNVNEYFLNLDANSSVKKEIDGLLAKIPTEKDKSKIPVYLAKCQEQTNKIVFPAEDKNTKELIARLEKFGVEKSSVESALSSIKKVWASKYNERAYISTSKLSITLNEIHMAVLCQKIIPAEYAFVIHTKNPSNNNPDEIYAEVVYGMGESLVGAYEGNSFSFIFNKKNSSLNVVTYPNKSIAITNSGFIFRSDSNTEDLEGFAGAGLFDSVPMCEDKKVHMSYSINKLFNDEGFANHLMKGISDLGVEVEKLFGGVHQDIEGVYYNNEFYIVQTRPQV